MPTPDELRAPIAAGRATLEAAIRAAAGAWEAKQPGDDWSPRAAAEHVIASEAYFATVICEACGYPGVEFEDRSYASADDALSALSAVAELSDGRLKYLTQEDLKHVHERWGTVAEMLAGNAAHLEEHATQMLAAAANA